MLTLTSITDEKVTQTVQFSNDASDNLEHASEDDDPQEGTRSVNRNYAIALLAEGLRSAAEESNDGNNKKAEKRLLKAIKKSKAVCPSKNDKHVKRVKEIATKYSKAIAGE